ncbi:unnamed protein product, partial [Rotaria magnacalcarata]
MTIVYKCSWYTVYFIITHSPNLRTLVLKDFWKDDDDESDDNIVAKSDTEQCTHLTSFSLYIRYDLTMNDVEPMFRLLLGLKHLRLFSWISRTDPSLFGGHRWENFIETKSPLLKQFDFSLTRLALENEDCFTVESLIASFRTPFWLETK